MRRRDFLKLLSSASVPLLSGCAIMRIDPWHALLRSDQILSLEDEQHILEKAHLGWTEDGKVRVLYLKGTPYERGYQHGALLREEVRDNLGYLHKHALKTYHFEELFAEAYERLRPYIPQDYVDEMHGLAHGAKLPLDMVHHVHALPSISEWGGKKALKKIVKKMAAGDFGTSCSNMGIQPEATSDGEFYAVRILDWGLHRISKLHEYPLITVTIPDEGIASANIGWVGFLGAVSGMNAQGITLGEMGYGSPPNETLRGKPMVFLLRDIMTHASSLEEVRALLRDSVGTNSFAFVMTDGKIGEAEIYIKDRDRFLTFGPGQDLRDDEDYPAIPGMVYGGHDDDGMAALLKKHQGRISPELLKARLIPEMAMKSNFQNVIYAPGKLQFWVNYAKDKKSTAFGEPYTFFDLGKALAAH